MSLKRGVAPRYYLLASVLLAVGCGGGGEDPGPLPDPNLSPDPSASTIPEQKLVTAFANTLYPLLVDHCAACHDEKATDPRPQFAHRNELTAYNVVIDKQLADFANPQNSRFYTRLDTDHHNCWTNDCTADAQVLADAITAWQAAAKATGNSLPIATNDVVTTQQNKMGKFGDLLANDSDPDGDPLTITSVDAQSMKGATLELMGNNMVNYTPPQDFTGSDTFTYTISDGKGGTANATVTVTVTLMGGMTVGSSSVDAFATTVYPLVRMHCANCHDGSLQQVLPLFASPDVQIAHDSTINEKLVNFGNTANSRIVARLTVDKHFCWTKDCAADGAEMLKAVDMWNTLRQP